MARWIHYLVPGVAVMDSAGIWRKNLTEQIF